MEETNVRTPIMAEGATRVEGRIRSFDLGRGYGFITPDDSSKDVFVHQEAIVGDGDHDLATGDRVSYELTMAPKGPRAASVRKL